MLLERADFDDNGGREKIVLEKERKGKQPREGEFEVGNGEFYSPKSINSSDNEERMETHDKRRGHSDLEESLYNKYGNRRGYSTKRSRRLRMNSTERPYSKSPMVSVCN